MIVSQDFKSGIFNFDQYMLKSKNIALFGGAFDPPHNGHIRLARAVVSSSHFDEFWFVPAGDSRYDKEAHEFATHRVAMLNIAIQEEFGLESHVKVEAAQAEEKLPGSYTIDLVRYLRTLHPSYLFSFVLGSDRIESLPEWKDFHELSSLVHFLAVPRLDDGVEELPPYVTPLEDVDFEACDIASSQIRGLIQAESSLQDLISPEVEKYIQNHGLYTKSL